MCVSDIKDLKKMKDLKLYVKTDKIRRCDKKFRRQFLKFAQQG